MRKLKLFIAQSVDGFIATKEGSVNWLEQTNSNENEDFGYNDFYNSVDTTIMGYNTYREILGFGKPFPYPDKINYIISRTHVKQTDNPVEFVKADIVEFVKQLKQKEGKDIWLVGGSEVNGILLNENMIDEIYLTIRTVVLGGGIPIFAEGTELKNFGIKEITQFSDEFVQLKMIPKNKQ